MGMLDEYAAFGVTVFMPDCEFQSEISRIGIEDTIVQMDADLDGMGVENDQETRICEIMLHAQSVIGEAMNGKIDQDSAITEITFAFVYAFMKEHGSMIGRRGIVGRLMDENLYVKPCLDNDEYVAFVKDTQEWVGSDGFDNIELPTHTIH